MYRLQRDANGKISGILRGGALIPIDMRNQDYADYLAWKSAGNAPEDPPAEVRIPESVTRFQAKAALTNAGLIGQIDALMSDPATPELYVLAWSETLHFERNSPSVLAIAGAIGLTESQIDDLFLSAASITA